MNDLTPKQTKDIAALLKACDKAVEDGKQANIDKQQVIKAQQDIIEENTKQIKELESSSHSILNSKPLWIGVGAVLTGIIAFLVKQ